MNDRYNTSGRDEGKYQANSNDLVLKNKLGLISLKEIEHIETLELAKRIAS